MIPRESLFRLPSCMAIKISPEGRRLTYVGCDEGEAVNLYLTSDLSLESAKKITFFDDPGIRSFYWSSDSKKILFLKDHDGTGAFNLYVMDLISLKLTNLTAHFSKINAKIFQVSEKEPKAVIGINHRNPRFHDLFLLDLETKTLSPFFENDQFIHFLFTESLEIALKVALNEDASLTLFERYGKKLFHFEAEEAFHTEFLKFEEKENVLFLLDNRASDTTQFKKINLNTFEEKVLGHHDKSDIHDVLFEKNKPTAFSTYFTEQKWHPLQEKVEKDFRALASKLGNNFEIQDQTPDGKFWIVKKNTPEKGIEFWLYNRPQKEFAFLYFFPHVNEMSRMYPLVLRSKDGLELVSYLTLPKEMDAGGVPKKALPLVVIPHGGPFKIRDFYAYSPFHQWLAARGYAVLSVNFRLSSGFGKSFVNAGNGEWGKKAHQDILDAVDYCVSSKIALKEKIAVFGISYGGYEALASLTFSPEVFACAVAICGPSNLKTVLDKVPFYWETRASPLSSKMHFFTKNAFIKSMGGDPDKPSDIPFLQKASPLEFVDAIQKPLLLVHGSNDPIVAASESDQIFDNLKQKKRKVIYLSYPDEGHGIVKFANSMSYLAYSEWLFAKILGGPYEPISREELQKSSVKIQFHGLDPHDLSPS